MEKESQSHQEPPTLLAEIAEQKKCQFVQLVEHLARLRDIQYAGDSAESVIKQAKKTVARNLPSNLLRSAAIFVDYYYGFPADQHSFFPPAWVSAKKLLPKGQRGSLICTGLKDLSELQENDVVVLIGDMVTQGLHAGMAGIVRELPTEEENDQTCLVEFGEPQESLTTMVTVPLSLLRKPRPGDLIEHYRL